MSFHSTTLHFKTAKGNYPCISSSVPPHLLRGTAGQKAVEVTDILFDAGFDSKEEGRKFWRTTR